VRSLGCLDNTPYNANVVTQQGYRRYAMGPDPHSWRSACDKPVVVINVDDAIAFQVIRSPDYNWPAISSWS
jgi:hypothetical protein